MVGADHPPLPGAGLDSLLAGGSVIDTMSGEHTGDSGGERLLDYAGLSDPSPQPLAVVPTHGGDRLQATLVAVMGQMEQA